MWLSATERRHTVHHIPTTPSTPPTLSRNNSSTSITSTTSDPTHHQPSTISSTSSTKKSHFSLFSSKKESQPTGKIVITSRHASTVRQNLLVDPRSKPSSHVKTAHVVGTHYNSGRLSAEAQEMRYPHSGPPALHPQKAAPQQPVRLQDMLKARHHKNNGQGDMSLPVLTRIVSGDMPDPEEEEEEDRRRRWGHGEKRPAVEVVLEHSGEGSGEGSRIHSRDGSRIQSGDVTPWIEARAKEVDAGELRRRMDALGVDHHDAGRRGKVIGGGWRLDERGYWTNR